MPWLKILHRPTLAWGSLIFAVILVLNMNFLLSEVLNAVRIDLTDDKRFTISEGTFETLKRIDEPIRINVYFSSLLGERAPPYAQHFDRVRTLLTQYEQIADGGLIVTYHDPEPYSRSEDRAVSERVRGIPINRQGELGYFGISMSNSVDGREVIGFLDLDREQFLEYDLTSRIFKLASNKKPVVGLITGLGIEGTVDPNEGVTQAWLFFREMRPFFEIQTLIDVNEIPSKLTRIPDHIDVLLLVQPLGLSPKTIYAIDQYVLRGGKVAAFLDPSTLAAAGISYDEKLVPLLNSWGIDIARDKVATDLKNARKSETGKRDERVFSNFIASIALGNENINQNDVVSAGIEKLNFMTPGIITKVEGAGTQVTDLLFTSVQSMVIDSKLVRSSPDPVALLRAFKSGGVPLTIASRISGTAKSAYPDGAPTLDQEVFYTNDKTIDLEHDLRTLESPGPHVASGQVNIIVIADVDMLQDRYWVKLREFFGEQIPLPHASNAAIAVSALENLSGGTALIALRARGIDDRPFDLVNELQVNAEQRFRETERGLANELKKLEKRIKDIESSSGGSMVLDNDDRQVIQDFRQRTLEVRGELREVKLALRRDIDQLSEALRVVNIAGVPIIFVIGGLFAALMRRRPGAAK